MLNEHLHAVHSIWEITVLEMFSVRSGQPSLQSHSEAPPLTDIQHQRNPLALAGLSQLDTLARTLRTSDPALDREGSPVLGKAL